ncbi:MAG: 50S ribosomal protein L23 [Bacteroidia bacterium]
MNVLVKPLITEKFTAVNEKLGQAGFIVDKHATKDEIKRAVEKMYSVNVTGISTMIYSGKTKTRFTRKGFFAGKKSGFKKAIVTLKEGQKIDFFQNV